MSTMKEDLGTTSLGYLFGENIIKCSVARDIQFTDSLLHPELPYINLRNLPRMFH